MSGPTLLAATTKHLFSAARTGMWREPRGRRHEEDRDYYHIWTFYLSAWLHMEVIMYYNGLLAFIDRKAVERVGKNIAAPQC